MSDFTSKAGQALNSGANFATAGARKGADLAAIGARKGADAASAGYKSTAAFVKRSSRLQLALYVVSAVAFSSVIANIVQAVQLKKARMPHGSAFQHTIAVLREKMGFGDGAQPSQGAPQRYRYLGANQDIDMTGRGPQGSYQPIDTTGRGPQGGWKGDIDLLQYNIPANGKAPQGAAGGQLLTDVYQGNYGKTPKPEVPDTRVAAPAYDSNTADDMQLLSDVYGSSYKVAA